jgi:hypothetical protein
MPNDFIGILEKRMHRARATRVDQNLSLADTNDSAVIQPAVFKPWEF